MAAGVPTRAPREIWEAAEGIQKPAKPSGHGLGDREPRAGGDFLPAQSLAQGTAADQLEDQEVALLALQIAVDAADVGMVEPGEEAGLEEEVGARSGGQPVAADGLQGDLALELFVEADEDGPHAPFGQ